MESEIRYTSFALQPAVFDLLLVCDLEKSGYQSRLNFNPVFNPVYEEEVRPLLVIALFKPVTYLVLEFIQSTSMSPCSNHE